MMINDSVRRWTREIEQLRTRIEKATKQNELRPVLEESLAMCESLIRELAGAQLEADSLTRRCSEESASWDHLFQQLPIACLETDASSMILTANRAASGLLNTGAKHLVGRWLLHFAADRTAFTILLQSAIPEASPRHTSLVLRPRERAPFDSDATVVPASCDGGTWLWFFSPQIRADRNEYSRTVSA